MKDIKKLIAIILGICVILIAGLCFFKLSEKDKNESKDDSKKSIKVQMTSECRDGSADAVLAAYCGEKKITSNQLEDAAAIIQQRLENRNLSNCSVSADADSMQLSAHYEWSDRGAGYDPEKIVYDLIKNNNISVRKGSDTIMDPQTGFFYPSGDIIAENKNIILAATTGENTSCGIKVTLDDESGTLLTQSAEELKNDNMPFTLWIDDSMLYSFFADKVGDNTFIVDEIFDTYLEANDFAIQLMDKPLEIELSVEDVTYSYSE